MSKLEDIIGNRKPRKSDWSRLADGWGVKSDYHLEDVAPADVSCRMCWDTGLCAECQGRYPNGCPSCQTEGPGGGRCSCQSR